MSIILKLHLEKLLKEIVLNQIIKMNPIKRLFTLFTVIIIFVIIHLRYQ